VFLFIPSILLFCKSEVLARPVNQNRKNSTGKRSRLNRTVILSNWTGKIMGGVESNCKNYCCAIFMNVYNRQLIGKTVTWETWRVIWFLTAQHRRDSCYLNVCVHSSLCLTCSWVSLQGSRYQHTLHTLLHRDVCSFSSPNIAVLNLVH